MCCVVWGAALQIGHIGSCVAGPVLVLINEFRKDKEKKWYTVVHPAYGNLNYDRKILAIMNLL